jgi:uncharacterized protein (TIGR00730 family)
MLPPEPVARMQSLCVFCGSRFGNRNEHRVAAEAVARSIAARGWRLVYGGGNVGLMGALADAALNAGGEVVGVIPRSLQDREVAHAGLTQLHVVETMHERKALMADLSDGFIALPGGVGTLEELFEVVTWRQLRIHTKPCGLLNSGGYFDSLLEFLSRSVDEDFLRRTHLDEVLVESDVETLLTRVEAATRDQSAGPLLPPNVR